MHCLSMREKNYKDWNSHVLKLTGTQKACVFGRAVQLSTTFHITLWTPSHEWCCYCEWKISTKKRQKCCCIVTMVCVCVCLFREKTGKSMCPPITQENTVNMYMCTICVWICTFIHMASNNRQNILGKISPLFLFQK